MVGTVEKERAVDGFRHGGPRVPLVVQAKRGMFLPAESNALREAGRIDALGVGAAADVKASGRHDP